MDTENPAEMLFRTYPITTETTKTVHINRFNKTAKSSCLFSITLRNPQGSDLFLIVLLWPFHTYEVFSPCWQLLRHSLLKMAAGWHLLNLTDSCPREFNNLIWPYNTTGTRDLFSTFSWLRDTVNSVVHLPSRGPPSPQTTWRSPDTCASYIGSDDWQQANPAPARPCS